jgi:hypothetical protein
LPKREVPHKPIESDIINKQQAAVISSWIDKLEPKLGFFASIKVNGKTNHFYEDVESYMYKPSKNPYEFSATLNNNITKALTIYKCLNSNKIIGEYKETSIITRHEKQLRYGPSTNSFLFSFESNSISNPVISRLELSKLYPIDHNTGLVNYDKVKFINYDNDKKSISLIPENIFDIRHFRIFRNSKRIKVERVETIEIVNGEITRDN